MTKACPKCSKRWGPPVACLHVTCHKVKGGCGYEWCWLCMKGYKEHKRTYYTCSAYRPDERKIFDK